MEDFTYSCTRPRLLLSTQFASKHLFLAEPLFRRRKWQWAQDRSDLRQSVSLCLDEPLVSCLETWTQDAGRLGKPPFFNRNRKNCAWLLRKTDKLYTETPVANTLTVRTSPYTFESISTVSSFAESPATGSHCTDGGDLIYDYAGVIDADSIVEREAVRLEGCHLL